MFYFQLVILAVNAAVSNGAPQHDVHHATSQTRTFIADQHFDELHSTEYGVVHTAPPPPMLDYEYEYEEDVTHHGVVQTLKPLETDDYYYDSLEVDTTSGLSDTSAPTTSTTTSGFRAGLQSPVRLEFRKNAGHYGQWSPHKRGLV